MVTDGTFAGRRCVFCAKTDGLSREHVLRDKFNVLFGSRRAGRRIVNFVGDQPVPTSDRTFVDKPYGQKVRQVCKECNNGWMNDLENAVESDLVALMRGLSIPFTMESRRVLALWAGKTALVRQLLSDPSTVIRDSHLFTEVMRGVPPMWGWLFASKLPKAPDSPRTRSTLLEAKAILPQSKVLVTTLHLEDLLLVSILPGDPDTGQVVNRLLATWEVTGMTTVYPSRRVIKWGDLPAADPDLYFTAAERYALILVEPDPGRMPPEPPADKLQEG